MSHRHQLVSLWDMLQFAAHDFVEIARDLVYFRISQRGLGGIKPILPPDEADNSMAFLTIRDRCKALGLPLTTRQCERVVELLQNNAPFVAIEKAIAEVSSRMQDELQAEYFLSLNAVERDLYQSGSAPFGRDVDDAFPGSREDIEEAGKCLALGRYTASIFHLSRAMEAAVQALSAKLGMSNLDREWGKLLSEMKVKIEAMPQSDIKNRWSENHSLLYHVKQAWRNDVMHPKATYTAEQAQEVYQAMRSFTRNLVPLIS